MNQPRTLQVGPYPAGDENPLQTVFHMHRLVEARTWHIVGRAVIEALGAQGMLVNIARASTIAKAALLEALETGRLGSAALDVFEGEPDPDPRFLALDNVLLKPHHASGTVETRRAMGQLVRDNLMAHFGGRPLPTPVL